MRSLSERPFAPGRPAGAAFAFTILAATLLAIAMPAGAALAQGDGSGPVAKACKSDITKLCPGLKHGQGEVRACLETHKEHVGAKCRKALEGTGGGK